MRDEHIVHIHRNLYALFSVMNDKFSENFGPGFWSGGDAKRQSLKFVNPAFCGELEPVATVRMNWNVKEGGFDIDAAGEVVAIERASDGLDAFVAHGTVF